METKSIRPSVEPWLTGIVTKYVDVTAVPKVWVPNCGRGDIVRDLASLGAEVFASDADMTEFDVDFCDCIQMDFPDAFQCFVPSDSVLVSMPPPKEAEQYMRQALSFPELSTVALLMPSNIKHDHGCRDLFTTAFGNLLFSYEVILTTKPHLFFYSWNPDDAKKVTKLDYSWFVWGLHVKDYPPKPVMFWEGRPVV